MRADIPLRGRLDAELTFRHEGGEHLPVGNGKFSLVNLRWGQAELADNIEALYANVRAFNRWMHEEVGFAHRNRMFLPPYIALADVDMAVKEVELLIETGAPRTLEMGIAIMNSAVILARSV